MPVVDRLNAHAVRIKSRHLRDIFADNPDRIDQFCFEFDDILLDFSKEKIDGPAFQNLLELAGERQVLAARDQMFAGEVVNSTEGRRVLHIALRDPQGNYNAPGAEEVAGVLARFLAFAEEVRSGRARNAAGEPFTDVISIGIGGSDLGSAMASRALAPFADGPAMHYVSNVDGSHFADVSAALDPARTLVIVQSKSFTTAETMTNARTARLWLQKAGCAPEVHMAAVSTNLAATEAFGIPDVRVFGFWDWVGGRYSLWSAIGLPLAIAIGAERFEELLAGARRMDVHFRSAPPEENLPLLLGLIGIWRRNFMGAASVAVIPYDQRLERFPAYLQQLAMESNGKSVQVGGAPVDGATCPVVWGEAGTNAQHSFFQLLHQGTDVIPVDFLLAATAREGPSTHHTQLMANCLAQSNALAFGRTAAEVEAQMRSQGKGEAEIACLLAHRVFPGDRPSTTILYRRLDPFTLGRLIVLYEHKTFVEAAIWGINAFDQWGVELGKELANAIIPHLEGEDIGVGVHPSTEDLIRRIKKLQG